MSDSRFRFKQRVSVRFRDLDPLGHAHHTVPIVYFEEARAEYWRRVAGRATIADIDYVVAEVRVQFKQRVLYPAELTVRAAVTHLGNASFVMRYELADEEGAILATGETVQVMYDFASSRSVPLPRELRERIMQFEGMAEKGKEA